MSQDFSQLFEQDRAHFMHPSTHAHDHASGALKGRIITGAEGIRLRDHEGREDSLHAPFVIERHVTRNGGEHLCELIERKGID